MPALAGNIQGLKPGQIHSLERLYKRRFAPETVWSQEQARELALLSAATGRQLGLLIDRAGKVRLVIAGTATSIYIPELPNLAESGKILRGWRLVHTHLGSQLLNQEDLLDMLYLRFDSLAVLTVTPEGRPDQWQSAWLNPVRSAASAADSAYIIGEPLPWHQNVWDETAHIAALEDEFGRRVEKGREAGQSARAILVSVSTEPAPTQEKHLDELAALADTAGLEPCGRLVQRVSHPDARMVLGKGKLEELELMALDAGAEILLFDGELNTAQLNQLASRTQRKVLDRTQLILDIFASHASTRAGKLQVELAQLAYLQPRLTGRNTALDRLAGGTGGRGPGETRLETDRRKIKERMAFLKRELDRLRKQRGIARNRRGRSNIPLVAFVGYTNAGKSSILNRLTDSSVLAANQLFATLDPVIRRLRFPEGAEIVLADTVGFIRNLPAELKTAFQATLEELDSAQALLHVVDCSSEDYPRQIEAVDNILEELDQASKPRLILFNKIDRLPAEDLLALKQACPDALFVSAATGEGLDGILPAISVFLKPKQGTS